MPHCYLEVALDTPLNSCFDYRWSCLPGEEPQVGQLVLVPFARREVVGLIVAVKGETEVPVDKLKDAIAVRSQLSPLRNAGSRWRASPPTTTSVRWARWPYPACRRTCGCPRPWHWTAR